MSDVETNGAGRMGPSRMAEGIALIRFAESLLPENERIFADPYAVHFVDPALLAWAKAHPQEVKARADEYERTMPGWGNSIRARIRYFDDAVRAAAEDGVGQVVVLGAGYDTRAHRIDALRGRTRVFEVDHPQTLERKIEVLGRVLEQVPGHVAFVPLDLERDDLWTVLERAGYSSAARSLFVLEGLAMYLPSRTLGELLAGVAEHAGGGSAILFDCVPRFLVDGSSDREDARRIRAHTAMVGEPIRSGFADGEVGPFLADFGFSNVTVVENGEYGPIYFPNGASSVSDLLTFVRAEVPG